MPDLVEVSPEELRLHAYMAKLTNTAAEFVRSVEEMQRKQEAVKQQYAFITLEQVEKMVRNGMRHGGSTSLMCALL